MLENSCWTICSIGLTPTFLLIGGRCCNLTLETLQSSNHMRGSMTLRYPITFIENPTKQDHSVIFNGINTFARSQGLEIAAGGYFFAVYDETKTIVAAISGFDNFGPAEIGGLWVHERFRGQGYGRALVQKVEEWGREKGCTSVTVFTLKKWPAYAWYQTLGFTVEFERIGHANNMIGCYLIKKLQDRV